MLGKGVGQQEAIIERLLCARSGFVHLLIRPVSQYLLSTYCVPVISYSCVTRQVPVLGFLPPDHKAAPHSLSRTFRTKAQVPSLAPPAPSPFLQTIHKPNHSPPLPRDPLLVPSTPSQAPPPCSPQSVLMEAATGGRRGAPKSGLRPSAHSPPKLPPPSASNPKSSSGLQGPAGPVPLSFSPPHALCSSHMGLLPVPVTRQTLTCPRTFALATPFA